MNTEMIYYAVIFTLVFGGPALTCYLYLRKEGARRTVEAKEDQGRVLPFRRKA